jgi:hypothetical protein
MEADRMGWMLPVLTPERFETQRGVVINERRQNYENRPYGLAQFAIARAVYPPDHPYAWPTIGETEDLVAATLDDTRDFFRATIRAASLAIAGDVAATDAFAMAVIADSARPGWRQSSASRGLRARHGAPDRSTCRASIWPGRVHALRGR